MAVFGLIFSALIYTSLIALFIFIIIIFLKKMYTLSYQLMMILFLHGLITIMGLSWGIIIMSGGFKVSVDLYIKNDYTWLLFFFIGILFVIVSMDVVMKKHVKPEENLIMEVSRFLLPVFNIISISFSTFLFYSSCNYFHFVTL